ncbi:MAG: hypothetical protein OEY98_02690, partial [Acidimicrobiia bacterium]|nr:hypothetical protein [Acidimicrobiia bacterium]
MRATYRKGLAAIAVLSLVMAACAQEAETTTTTAAATPDTTVAATPDTTAAATPDTTMEDMTIATDIGVTEEPCPGGNPDRGCIYLGVLTDESGPFQAAAPALYGAQQLFWGTVNAGDGIGGAYDVALP